MYNNIGLKHTLGSGGWHTLALDVSIWIDIYSGMFHRWNFYTCSAILVSGVLWESWIAVQPIRYARTVPQVRNWPFTFCPTCKKFNLVFVAPLKVLPMLFIPKPSESLLLKTSYILPVRNRVER